MIDIKRRFFLFGAAAALILPPKRTFHILPPPTIIRPKVGDLIFDLPRQQSLDLMLKVLDQMYPVSAIPRWLVVNREQYDLLVSNRGNV